MLMNLAFVHLRIKIKRWFNVSFNRNNTTRLPLLAALVRVDRQNWVRGRMVIEQENSIFTQRLGDVMSN